MRQTAIEQLPEVIPIFPLTGALLLPFGKLPLNIFEPRYLAMTRSALAHDWLIGMVQPIDPDHREDNPAVYPVGCAGRIINLAETDDGRYLITLAGMCRFTIVEELDLQDGFRRTRVDWSPYGADFRRHDPNTVDRGRLMTAVRSYFQVHKIEADLSALDDANTDQLVITLAMACPFEPREKQALLESPGLAERGELMISLLTMSVLDQTDGMAPN